MPPPSATSNRNTPFSRGERVCVGGGLKNILPQKKSIRNFSPKNTFLGEFSQKMQNLWKFSPKKNPPYFLGGSSLNIFKNLTSDSGAACTAECMVPGKSAILPTCYYGNVFSYVRHIKMFQTHSLVIKLRCLLHSFNYLL